MRLAVPGQPVEVAALHPLADLTVDPRLPADAEGLALGHSAPVSRRSSRAADGHRTAPTVADAPRRVDRGRARASTTTSRDRSPPGGCACGSRRAASAGRTSTSGTVTCAGRSARRPATSWPARSSTARPVSPTSATRCRPTSPAAPASSAAPGAPTCAAAADPASGSVGTVASPSSSTRRWRTWRRSPTASTPVTASLTEPLAVTVRGVGLGARRARQQGARARRRRHRSVRRPGRARPGRRGRDHGAVPAPARRRRAHRRDGARRGRGGHWGKEHRPEVVIESVGGTADTLTDAVRVVGRGGRIVVLGTFSEPRLVDLQRLMMKEGSIVGSFCYGCGDREPSSRRPPA